MREDKPFMHRAEWMANGKPKYTVFCPVTPAERLKRQSAPERRRSNSEAVDDAEAEVCKTTLRSALELQFDWELHQMVGYMRRIDGEGQTKKRTFRMDPFAPDGEPKYATDGRATGYFGYWFFVAWNNVLVPSLKSTFGNVLTVLDRDDLANLLGTTVMM
jgi:hypothetical protein